MFRYIATLAFAFSAVALGASADISKVNGSIVVEAGQQAGDVSTVNGSITVGRGGADPRRREYGERGTQAGQRRAPAPFDGLRRSGRKRHAIHARLTPAATAAPAPPLRRRT